MGFVLAHGAFVIGWSAFLAAIHLRSVPYVEIAGYDALFIIPITGWFLALAVSAALDLGLEVFTGSSYRWIPNLRLTGNLFMVVVMLGTYLFIMLSWPDNLSQALGVPSGSIADVVLRLLPQTMDALAGTMLALGAFGLFAWARSR